jgi:hypothetical protein
VADWIDRIARWSARSEDGPREAAVRRMEVALDRKVSRRGALQVAALATVGGAAAGKVASSALAGTSGVCEQSSLDRCLDRGSLRSEIAEMLCRFEKPADRAACRDRIQGERSALTKACLGNYCNCPDGQEACAASGVPGVCCPAGQICQIDANGASCVDPAIGPPPRPVPCESDPSTADSLFAASAALAGGADQVPLSPGGCLQYKRVRNGDDVVSEQITGAGALLAEYGYSATGATGRQDSDGDGFFEWRATLSRGSDPQIAVVIEEYDPSTQKLVKRQTRAQHGATVHHVWEIDEGAGLETIREFDAPTDQASDGSSLPSARVTAAQSSGGPHPEFGWLDCDDDVRATVTTALENCMKKVLPCLDKNKAPGLKNEMAKIFAGKTTFTCSSGGAMANLVESTAHPLTTDTKVRINPDRLGSVSPDSLICHELMHATSLGVHDPDLTEVPQEFDDSELDRVKGCTTLCFGGGFVNQCHCATCLGTTVCDDRCKNYSKCANCEKGVCPCEDTRQRYYASVSNCKAKCPTSSANGNGLKCFAIQCKGISLCCKK